MSDDIKGKIFKVLGEDQSDGFVRLVDYMGDDHAIAEAARVSYGKGTKSVSDDEHLIQYLMRHGHMSPFEMAEIKLHVRVPMDIWRQWIRHRTANVNEYSTRYSEAITSAYLTIDGEWRKQSTSNKQGSAGYFTKEESHSFTMDETCSILHAHETYRNLIDGGVAREQARKVLPLCTYTEAYWKIDVRNLIHFLALRMEPHAQKEIRDYATTIYEKILKPLFPATAKAADMYIFHSVELSVRDQWVLQRLLETKFTEEQFLAVAKEALPTAWGAERCRERDECLDKFKKLGIIS